MPSINNARAKNAARIAAGGETGTGVGNPVQFQKPIEAAPTAPNDLPIGGGLPQRGMFSADLVLASDRSDSSRVFRGPGMRSATFPYQPQVIKTAPAITVPAAQSAAAAASTLALQVNGIPNPNQKLLNMVAGSGMVIDAAPDGSVLFTVSQGSNNAFSLIDNFHGAMATSDIAGAIPLLGIGELGWTLKGTVGNNGGILGGTFPNVGQFGWSNSDTASQAGWLTFAGSGSFSTSGYSQLGYGLADTPGAVLTYTFKLEASNALGSNMNFDTTDLAMYVGLTGPNIGGLVSAPVSRPNFFIGVRYDTSTTSPSIADSFFTLEVVSNPVTTLGTYTRDNTQGTTFVTNIAPVPGEWHTLTLDFTVAGQVTLTLDGTQSLTATIPTLTITGTLTTLAQNGAARLNWTVSGTAPQPFWNAGSIVTVSGFTGGLAAFNGVQNLTAADENSVGFDLPGVTTSGSGTATLEGFPSMTPLFMMGNTDAAPSAFNLIMFVADYFSLIWNPVG